MPFIKNAQKALQQNIREYGMYIALMVIMVVFTITTKGTCISSRNTSNLINQNGYIMVLAVGMTLVIVTIGILPGVHKLTLFLGLLAIILFIVGQLNDRKKKQAYHFEVLPMDMFVLQLAFVSVLIGGMTWVFAGYQGLSWTAVVVLIVVAVYHYITTQTVLGRQIYAVGGNPEAAELSGINVKRLTYVVFCSMGMLTALSGILYASRLRSASTTAGNLFELEAIAAAYVGGVSAGGGVGKVVGSLIGAFVMASLTNGMNLMGIDISVQYLVRALVLAAAVIFDVATRTRAR
jgi:putative multiple sugar transport system permease protein